MSVRAKFICDSKTELRGNMTTIKLVPVMQGSEENKSFYRWTSSGSIDLQCLNPAASEKFTVGKEYYVDFEEAICT